MIQQSTLQFLKNLKKNNNKEWFDKNRPRYEEARADFEDLTREVLERLSKTDDSIAHLQPRECLFRINRDIRFSKNKTPYKTNMAMYISRDGKKGAAPGYYFHMEPGSSFVAGGIWMPPAEDLRKIRQEIDYNFDEFSRILGAKKFRSVFGGLERTGDSMLSRPPKGYDAGNPAIEYLKFKSLIASATINDSELTSKQLARKLTDHFGVIKPLISFFNEALH